MSLDDHLPSWRPGPSRDVIVEFVESAVSSDAERAIPPAERVAVFDNDGTLWCEKPMPIQLDFILRRLLEMAEADASLRDRQPWKAAYGHDYPWLSSVLKKHYAGDDSLVPVLAGGILAAFANISVETFADWSDSFMRSARHPTLGLSYLECGYAPMVELLDYLADNGFTSYIASGGGRDFMRPTSDEMYRIPPERVIGSSSALTYAPDDKGGSIIRQAAVDYLDDGPEKPVHIWNRTGRRPVLAAGNSNGDIEMLDFAQRDGRPTLRLLVLHDDQEREFAYTTGAEKALERARAEGWTVVSIRDDWERVF